jgi:hypothetical protein
VEFKHQNISATLMGLGEAWIIGYKPAFNFQSSLKDAVLRWLSGTGPVWSVRQRNTVPRRCRTRLRSGSVQRRPCRTIRRRRSWTGCCD